MPTPLIRKLVLILPALWLLVTLIFLLSRLLPGSFGAARFLEDESGYYSTGSSAGRQQAYVQYQQKKGLSAPVFYFSISPVRLPDTLQQVFPEARREQLQHLSFRYGAWSEVAAYDALVQAAIKATTPQTAANLQTLRYGTDPNDLQKAAQQYALSADPNAVPTAKAIAQQLELLESGSTKYDFLLPRLHWHGTQNQYHQWLTGMIAGDFGSSYRTDRPVLDMLWEAVGNTFWLLLCSMLLTLTLALVLSIRMAKARMQWLRRVTFPSLFILDSIPLFVLALLLMLLLANPDFLQLFPMYGMGYYASQTLTLGQQMTQWFQFMALPMLCLVLVNLPYLCNQFYTSLQAALQADYIRTAKAKGLPEQLVISKHALRNALLPLITLVSEFFPTLVGGAFVIETIFAIPGVGQLLVESVLARDYPVLLAIVLLILAVRMMAYALADVGYALADPRIKQRAA